ncbi:MAG: hypothetical protein RML15_02705 [Bacteroidota bacterium]|nr:hypothetical protein [Bacteroidota bacterium]
MIQLRTRYWAILLGTLIACQQSEQIPLHLPAPGSDTMFSIPSLYAGKSTIVRYADLDRDGWKDVLLLVRGSKGQIATSDDSLIVFRFNPTKGIHVRTSAYGDYGITAVETIQHRSFTVPLVILSLDGGGNDATTFGKVILVWQDSSLHTLATAPWGDPTLMELDSHLVLEIHQTFSGSLPHAMALEYSDSLIAVSHDAYALPYRELLRRRIEQYRVMLDSLWLHRHHLTSDKWGDVTSMIMSLANLVSKQQGIVAAKRILATERQRWSSLLPAPYRQLLDDFSHFGQEEYWFIR